MQLKFVIIKNFFDYLLFILSVIILIFILLSISVLATPKTNTHRTNRIVTIFNCRLIFFDIELLACHVEVSIVLVVIIFILFSQKLHLIL